MSVQIDVGFGDAITPGPVDIELPGQFDQKTRLAASMASAQLQQARIPAPGVAVSVGL